MNIERQGAAEKRPWLAALLLGLSASAVALSGTYSMINGYVVPTAGSSPTEITPGPDGALWFTDDNKIGRITPPGSCGIGRGHVQPLAPISGLPCVSNRS